MPPSAALRIELDTEAEPKLKFDVGLLERLTSTVRLHPGPFWSASGLPCHK
jgi:hypothetical protein